MTMENGSTAGVPGWRGGLARRRCGYGVWSARGAERNGLLLAAEVDNAAAIVALLMRRGGAVAGTVSASGCLGHGGLEQEKEAERVE